MNESLIRAFSMMSVFPVMVAEKPKTYSEERVDALLEKVEALGAELDAKEEGE